MGCLVEGGGERGLGCEGLWFTRWEGALWEVYQRYFSELNVTHLTCPPNDCTFYLNDIDFGKWLPFDHLWSSRGQTRSLVTE